MPIDKETQAKLCNIKGLVWELLAKTSIGLAAFGSDGELDLDDLVYDNLLQMQNDMGAEWFEYGMTKVVFAFGGDLEKYVIKIPFMGVYYHEMRDGIEDLATVFFNEAGYGNDNCWDYCETEAENYQYALEEGVADFFAATYYLGDYEGCPIYISEKVTENDEPDYDSYDRAQFIPVWYEKIFGKEITNYLSCKYDNIIDLLRFLDDYDIDDMHESNFCILKNGNIKIIDYSSYRDEW